MRRPNCPPIVSACALALVVTVAGADTLGASGATRATAAVRQAPCTAADLAGTESGIPLMIQDPANESFPDSSDSLATLVTQHRYAAVVDESRATRFATATVGESVPVEGSVHVTGPSGLTLTPATKDFMTYYKFTAPAPGPLRLQATWQQDVTTYSPRPTTVTCAASAALDASVLAPKSVTTHARFYEGYRFELRVVNATPPDTRPVTALLRVRRDVATPPSAKGHVAARVTFNPLRAFDPSVAYRGSLKLHFGAESENGGVSVQVDPDGNFPRGTLLRLGFSVELIQGGRRVGGMRSGVVCRRVQFAGHSEPRCTHPGFAQQP